VKLVEHIDVLLTMDSSHGDRLGRIIDGAVLMDGDRIVWCGASDKAPEAEEVVDGSGCIGLPGLIDCHTHMAWAGSRADEFQQRLAGAQYSDILEAGGGILSTVGATRRASLEWLTEVTEARLRRAAAQGVTTVEIKSGYGLESDTERRQLLAARAAAARVGVQVVTTFLGAHAIPAEWRPDREGYIRDIVEKQLPNIVDVADCIDAYVDRGAFTVEEGRRILRAGKEAGLTVRVHAEQVAHTGAAAMAARLGATSADHLEQIDDGGIAAMAAAGTVAVLLPGAMLYLKDRPPPVERLRAAGVPMAVATDFNPGSSPVADLWTCMTLACVTMGLTVEEALLGTTVHAASALGLAQSGQLKPGFKADLALFKPPPGEPVREAVLVQHLGGHRAYRVWAAGERVDLS
jgi:imidazolonepropionase